MGLLAGAGIGARLPADWRPHQPGVRLPISWIDWIERIPLFETKNYVQRVLENAVVYETLHPDKSAFGRSRGINEFLR